MIFVTNVERLSNGIKNNIANSILIKVNQIETLTETINAVNMAHEAGFTCVMSHRSGETEDNTIADLAAGLSTGQIKTGSASSDRKQIQSAFENWRELMKKHFIKKEAFKVNF